MQTGCQWRLLPQGHSALGCEFRTCPVIAANEKLETRAKTEKRRAKGKRMQSRLEKRSKGCVKSLRETTRGSLTLLLGREVDFGRLDKRRRLTDDFKMGWLRRGRTKAPRKILVKSPRIPYRSPASLCSVGNPSIRPWTSEIDRDRSDAGQSGVFWSVDPC
jgi:hypothetical protein